MRHFVIYISELSITRIPIQCAGGGRGFFRFFGESGKPLLLVIEPRFRPGFDLLLKLFCFAQGVQRFLIALSLVCVILIIISAGNQVVLRHTGVPFIGGAPLGGKIILASGFHVGSLCLCHLSVNGFLICFRFFLVFPSFQFIKDLLQIFDFPCGFIHDCAEIAEVLLQHIQDRRRFPHGRIAVGFQTVQFPKALNIVCGFLLQFLHFLLLAFGVFCHILCRGSVLLGGNGHFVPNGGADRHQGGEGGGDDGNRRNQGVNDGGKSADRGDGCPGNGTDCADSGGAFADILAQPLRKRIFQPAAQTFCLASGGVHFIVQFIDGGGFCLGNNLDFFIFQPVKFLLEPVDRCSLGLRFYLHRFLFGDGCKSLLHLLRAGGGDLDFRLSGSPAEGGKICTGGFCLRDHLFQLGAVLLSVQPQFQFGHSKNPLPVHRSGRRSRWRGRCPVVFLLHFHLPHCGGCGPHKKRRPVQAASGGDTARKADCSPVRRCRRHG